MKSHISLSSALTADQRREVNEKIMVAYRQGNSDGSKQALLYCLVSLHNLYGWKQKPLEKIMLEIMALAGEALVDPDMYDRMRSRMKDIGIEITGKFNTYPNEAQP